MKNITVLLPIHMWDDDHKIMFKNAVESVENFYNDVKLIVIAPTSISNEISIDTDKLEYKILQNTCKILIYCFNNVK